MANTRKITLTAATGTVEFYSSPEMEESGSTIYISLDDIRSPASLMIWMGSPARTFSINAKLISRTQDEADESFTQKSLLQAWRMPTGAGIAQSSVPEIIYLNGYGNQFNNIPCVVQSLNISYPTDVDYIISSAGFNVPIIWPVSVVLREFHTTDDMASFDYDAYKSGNLEGWN
jgi:hypothetical protein